MLLSNQITGLVNHQDHWRESISVLDSFAQKQLPKKVSINAITQ